MLDILEYLRKNTYPGRGILAAGGCVCYFIMGRSENSRNRIFVRTDDGIRTQAYDPARLQDPSLILYHPVRRMGSALVVTNGDQTDTICQAGEFRRALLARCYEPDAPNWTPRISSIFYPDGRFSLSILRRAADGRCSRDFFDYENCPAGTGYFISTYQHDGNPLPSFSGAPLPIQMPAPEALWAALNPENKISLYTNFHGNVRLFNKHLGD